MTDKFEESVFGEMDDIRGDNRVAVPDVGHIHRRVAAHQRRAGIAIVALLIAGLGGFWATRQGTTELATGDDTTPAIADDSAPVVLEFDEWPGSSNLDSNERFGEWMIANRLRDDRRPFVVGTILDNEDPTLDGVKIHLSTFPLDESFEYFAVIYTQCGPRVTHGMLEFAEDGSVLFREGRRPSGEDVAFGDVGYLCSPPTPQKLLSVLDSDFGLSAGNNSLVLSNDAGTINFTLTDLDSNPVGGAGNDDGLDLRDRLIAQPQWQLDGVEGVPEIRMISIDDLIDFGDNFIGFGPCLEAKHEIHWTSTGFTLQGPVTVDPGVAVPMIGCGPLGSLDKLPMPVGLEVVTTANRDGSILLSSKEWAVTIVEVQPRQPLSPESYISATVEEAAELAARSGQVWRVSMIDGVRQRVRSDLVPGRLNFVVEDGLIVDAIVEGQTDDRNEKIEPGVVVENECEGIGLCVSGFHLNGVGYSLSCGAIADDAVGDEVLGRGTVSGQRVTVHSIGDYAATDVVAISLTGGLCGDENPEEFTSPWSIAFSETGTNALDAMCEHGVMSPELSKANGCES